MSLLNHPYKYMFWLGFIYSVLALIGAYATEYSLHIHPCILCLYQRGVLFIVVIAGLAEILMKRDILRFPFLYPLLFCLNLGIAGYHSGIETKFFSAPKQCQGSLAPHHGNVDSLRKMLLKKQMPPCDEVTWHIFGLSMANYNALASLLILLGWGWAFTRTRKELRL